jgi:hypothetical protein
MCLGAEPRWCWINTEREAGADPQTSCFGFGLGLGMAVCRRERRLLTPDNQNESLIGGAESFSRQQTSGLAHHP